MVCYEKTRERCPEGLSGDHFGWRDSWAYCSEPRAEVFPDERWEGGREVLEHALGDEADLDIAMISVEFAADGIAVFFGFMMEVLVP